MRCTTEHRQSRGYVQMGMLTLGVRTTERSGVLLSFVMNSTATKSTGRSWNTAKHKGYLILFSIPRTGKVVASSAVVFDDTTFPAGRGHNR